MSILDMQIEKLDLTHADRLSHVQKLDPNNRKAWFIKEKEFWEGVHNSIKHSPTEHYYQNTVTRYLFLIGEFINDSEDLTKIRQFHSEFSIPLHDETPHNQLIQEFANRGQISTGLYMFSTLLNQQGAIYNSKYKIELLNIEENLKSAINEKHESFLGSLTEAKTSFDAFADTKEKEVKTKLWETVDNATTEINNTVTAATNAILSAEPVKYWEEREKKHRTKAKSYKRGVIATSIAFISTLIFLTLSVYKNGEIYTILNIPITLPAEKFSIALLVISTTAAIWLVRILVKLMMTNLALEIEALERSTMIKTYIAIDSTKAGNSAEIQMLFYTTLFRPSSNSLTDDSTSPEYIRIIEAMLQKKP